MYDIHSSLSNVALFGICIHNNLMFLELNLFLCSPAVAVCAFCWLVHRVAFGFGWLITSCCGTVVMYVVCPGFVVIYVV